MKTLINYILGELLFLANSQPPRWREEFYKVKDHVLTTYADLEGHHLQHIFKECFNCNGRGKVMKEVRMLGELIMMPVGACPKCNGCGAYDQFWTVLESYRLGRRRFHRPIKKCYSQASLPKLEFQEFIDGYIRHDRPKHYLYTEAAFWLYLIFDRKAFFKRFGSYGQCSRKVTPLVILSTWIYETRGIRHQLGSRIYELKKRLIKFRQAHCRHQFPYTNIYPAWDECKHCGIKRIYLTEYRDVVPF